MVARSRDKFGRFSAAEAAAPNATTSSDIIVDGVNFSNLYRAIEVSYKNVEWSRILYRNLVKSATGPAYGAQGGPETPINMLNQFMDAYTSLCVPENPQCDVESPLRSLKAFAGTFKRSVNHLGEEIGIRETFRSGIGDGFYLAGVVKIHRDNWRLTQLYDLTIDPGIPSATPVPPEDWAYDASAKKWSQIKWCADKYRVPFASIKEGVERGLYDKAVADQCEATSKHNDQDRVDHMSADNVTDDDELEPMIDLFDVWVQKTNKVYVCVVEDSYTFKPKHVRPLMSFDWTDPDHPPHHILSLSDVPHNIMPLSPALQLDPMNRALNANMVKEIDNVSAQKQIPVYSAQGEQTMTKVVGAPNLQPVQGDPSTFKVVSLGGIDPNSHQALVAWMEIIDMIAGNLRALMGLGATAPTLGQEQLIASAGNRKVATIKSRIATWMAGIYKSLGFMVWEDQFHEFVNTVELAGYTSDKDVWRPGEREGNFLQYNFKVNAHDLTTAAPAMQAELLMGVVERIFAPMIQMIMAQGGQIDFAALSEQLAEMLNLPVLRDVVRYVDQGMDEEEPATSVRATSSPTSTRTQIRRSEASQGTTMSRLQESAMQMQPLQQQQGAPAA